LVLFVTSADRPFSESERAFLEKLRAWGKKIVLVINKADLLERAEDLQQVISFVRENARLLLGTDPEVFPVSAKLALRAKQGEKPLWEASRFEALETYIRDTLDQTERIRLKLLNPLGVGFRLAQEHAEKLAQELAVLEEDLKVIEKVIIPSLKTQGGRYIIVRGTKQLFTLSLPVGKYEKIIFNTSQRELRLPDGKVIRKSLFRT